MGGIMTDQGKVVGMAAMLDNVDALIRAAEAVRDAGYKKWDCHTPYPVHGLDDAMGLRESFIPYITITAGLIGATVAKSFQWWVSAVDYPLIIPNRSQETESGASLRFHIYFRQTRKTARLQSC